MPWASSAWYRVCIDTASSFGNTAFVVDWPGRFGEFATKMPPRIGRETVSRRGRPVFNTGDQGVHGPFNYAPLDHG